MSQIKIADIDNNRIQLHWKCDSCRWSLNYFNEPKELQSFLIMAMKAAIGSHLCKDEHK